MKTTISPEEWAALVQRVEALECAWALECACRPTAPSQIIGNELLFELLFIYGESQTLREGLQAVYEHGLWRGRAGL
jgi:hypothetical protein